MSATLLWFFISLLNLLFIDNLAMSVTSSKLPASMSKRAQQTVIDAAAATVVLGSKVPGWLGTIAVTIYSGAHRSVDAIMTTIGYSQRPNVEDRLPVPAASVAPKAPTWQERIWGVKTVSGDEAV